MGWFKLILLWFTRERRLIFASAVYTAGMVYTHNIVSYVFAALFVIALLLFAQ